jgi:hypothetical protein
MSDRAWKVTGLSSILALIGTIITGWIFIDDRYAHAEDVHRMEQRTVQTLETYQRTQVVNQLNQLAIKEKLGEMTKYDAILKEQLERELQLLTEDRK